MIKESITPQEVVEFLNSLLEIDGKAMSDLFSSRVPCNEGLRDHPTVQVAVYDPPVPRVGILGVLNGLFGTFDSSDWGCIAMDMNREGSNEILQFRVLTEEQTQSKENS